MKIKLLIFTIALVYKTIDAQVPFKFRYSAEIRLNNELIISQDVDLRISLLQDSVNGKVVFSEEQSVKTNNTGVAEMVIGDNDSKILSSINWNNGLYFIRTEIDVNSDREIDNVLTNQILSVPYAFQAKCADKLTGEIDEKDPYFKNSVASGITQNDTANWSDIANRHKHFIGELYGGGIVYWVTPDGQHGLIVSLQDLIGSKKVKWDPRPNPQKSIIGAQSYFDGKSNTVAILKDFKDSGYPATECSKYVNDGFNDWYLPSNQELQLMMDACYIINRVLAEDNNPNTNGLTLINKVGEYGRYWSSTEHATNGAYLAFFTHKKMDFDRKDTYARVRSIRSF